MFRRKKRLARLHLHDAEPSFEGILLGRWDGHYHLLHARLVHGPERSVDIDGRVEVPAERVLFCQVLDDPH